MPGQHLHVPTLVAHDLQRNGCDEEDRVVGTKARGTMMK